MVRSGLPSLEIQSPFSRSSPEARHLGGRGQGDHEVGLGEGFLGLLSRSDLGGSVFPEEPAQVGLGREPRDAAAHGGVGLYLGRVEKQLLAPHQSGLDALFDDPLEEATEDLQPVALADAGEARMVGQGLEEVVAEVPPQREAVRYDLHQLALGAKVFEEHHQLQLEEDDRVHRRPAAVGVQRGDQLPDEREIQPSLQAAVEVVFGDQILEREVVG